MALRIVFMGTPEFAVPCLGALVEAGFVLPAVYTQPDRPAGRGKGLAQPPVKRLALERGIEVVQPPTLRTSEAQQRLAGFMPDLIVVAAYGLLLPKAVLAIPKHGCLNVHPSLLPRHRGPSPIPCAILEGDTVTGVSMMLMDAGMDTGPVLEQRELPISEDDTGLTLAGKLATLAAGMLPSTVGRRVRGEPAPIPQDDSKATYSRLITRQDGKIDWHLPAVQIWRRVRAFQPWPGCYTTWQGKTLKVIQAVPFPGSNGSPGEVVSLSDPRCPAGVVTGEGVLGLMRLQLEGRKEAAAAEFLRGQRGFPGSTLG